MKQTTTGGNLLSSRRMNLRRSSPIHEPISITTSGLITCRLLVLILLQDFGRVQAMGRSPLMHFPRPHDIDDHIVTKEATRGLGLREPDLPVGITLARKAAHEVEGTTALRGTSQHDSTARRDHRQGLVPKFHLAALEWSRSLKMPKFVSELDATGWSQISALTIMSIALVVWVLQAVRSSLNTLMQTIAEAKHAEQMKRLISELEASVREGGARLPQSLQKDCKGDARRNSKHQPKLEITQELKAYGPYLELAGES